MLTEISSPGQGRTLWLKFWAFLQVLCAQALRLEIGSAPVTGLFPN